jgi:hypothetical protein
MKVSWKEFLEAERHTAPKDHHRIYHERLEGNGSNRKIVAMMRTA